MDFYQKPDLETIKKDRENRAYLQNRYHTRFLVGTVAMLLVIMNIVFSNEKTAEKNTPSQNDLRIAATLTTIETRENTINEKYDGAKITRERTCGKDIVSVFEVDDMYSFCVFEAIEEGYWMEYCGNLFPKTQIVKGTVYLGDNNHEYDIYLQNDNTYTSLLIDRVNMQAPHNTQQEKIHFDEKGIAIMELDPDIKDPAPRIVAYDDTGNYYILADGTL